MAAVQQVVGRAATRRGHDPGQGPPAHRKRTTRAAASWTATPRDAAN